MAVGTIFPQTRQEIPPSGVGETTWAACSRTIIIGLALTDLQGRQKSVGLGEPEGSMNFHIGTNGSLVNGRPFWSRKAIRYVLCPPPERATLLRTSIMV